MIRMGRQIAKRWGGKIPTVQMGRIKPDKLKSIKSYVTGKESKEK